MNCFHDWFHITAKFKDAPTKYYSTCRKCGEVWYYGHIQNSLARKVVNFILRK